MVNFKTNHLTFNKSNITATNNEYIKISTAVGPFILFVPPNNNLSFRSSFVNGSKYNMYIMVTNEALVQLKALIANNNTVDCFIPYEVSEANIDNVMGYLQGTDTTSSPIIVSAHFDHIGTDLNGTIYNGALDNASGISFMLEMSKYLTSLGKPNRSILFIGFNAEEFGCLGSTAFITKYKANIKASKVFNFDMIGSIQSSTLKHYGWKEDTIKTPLIKSVSRHL